MENRLFIGNLAYSITDRDLSDEFGAYGQVQSAKVMSDRETGRSKGFGFVEMATASEAQAAISALNGKDLGGRALVVNVARPREERPGGFGGGNRGGNRGGGGGYGGYGGGQRDRY